MKSDNSIAVKEGDALHYMPQLDALRVFAVAAVFVTHFTFRTPVLGKLGVQLFFVLSGFLITSILLRTRSLVEDGRAERKRELVHFYARRFFRLFPALFLLITILLVVNWGTIRQDWAWHLFYLSNIYFTRLNTLPAGGIAVLWTLSVEEQFYIFWALVILLAPRRFHVPAALIAIGTALLWRSAIWRFHLTFFGGYVLPFNWLDVIGTGAILALSREKPDALRVTSDQLRRGARNVGVPLFVLSLTAIVRGSTSPLLLVFADFCTALAFTWIVAEASLGIRRISRFLEWPPVLYLGRISYGLYLYHFFTQDVMNWFYRALHISLTPWFVPWGLVNFWTSLAGGFGTKAAALSLLVMRISLAVVLAALSWHLWEKPIRRAGVRRLHVQASG
jgi:peptidoglycan/LPS O-acetylase OafA/YrhL